MRAALETTIQDLRYAGRVLRRSPGFTFFSVLTVALGLGANAAIFSLVDGVLLKSVGYPEPERIVQLWEKPPRGLRNGISGANYIDWSRQSAVVRGDGGANRRDMSYTASGSATAGSASQAGGSEPRALTTGVVSAPFFEVWGVRPALGRTFARDEDQRGKEKVTVLTHRLWLNAFGGDAGIVDRTILLNGEPYTVIGVLPGNSEFDRRGRRALRPAGVPAEVRRATTTT